MSGPSAAAAASSWTFESQTPLSLSLSLPFHASHSAPDLLAAPGRPLPKPPPSALDTAPVDRSPGFKSLPLLPGLGALDLPSFDLVSEFEKSFSFTTVEELAPRPATATAAPAATTLDIEFRTETESDKAAGVTAVNGHARSRSKSMVDRPLSWLPGSKSSPNLQASQEQHRLKRPVRQNVVEVHPERAPPAGKPVETPRPADKSFADFAKRSWISKSRSSSAPSKPENSRAAARSVSAAQAPATPDTKTAPGSQAGADATGTAAAPPPSSKRGAFNRASIYLTRIKQKPFSRSSSSPSITLKTSVKSAASSDSDSPSTSTPTSSAPSSPAVTIVKNASYISVSSVATSRTSSHRATSVDTDRDTDTTAASSASENTSQSTVDTSVTMPHPTSVDPLWATYRTVDIEFSRFAAKGSTAGRMSVVRSILVPFLRSTAGHPSNSNRSILAAEDVDRRATILNKWWNGLLGMLIGANSRLPSGLGQSIASLGVHFPVLQPVAGVDRPTLLEATAMIMMRPEWRACTSQFRPLADRCPEERVRPRSGTHSSVASDADALLAESAEHNVRTMFVTNLTTQMALVVEKLSLRHAPLSLVNWCGKACAYAFFFVPGISDVLVRLWGLSADQLRRIADEFGLPRRSRGESDDIVALFPSHLHKLGWSSVKSLGDKLRVAAKLPLMLAKIHWHGPWISRWRGGDTDLVFIFSKYFYILAQDFIPEGLPLVEKARAPAFVLVHAHLLSILDSSIHRQASLDAMLGPPLSDALHGADAALTAPQLPSNLLKGMDENRLVILLKDMLAESSFAVDSEIKHTFAEAFVAVAKAAAKRTPRFDHASCFMLCDFLEEALVALDAFQSTVNSSVATSPPEVDALSHYFEPLKPSHAVDYIDWPFWFEVGKMIMDSNNTMSEIRILSFFYSIWDVITADPARKEAVCLDWLLSEEIFAKFFCHWCPMVRAYYMRLLCWRICRDSGSSNEVDAKIFLLVSQRLKTIWSHYLWVKQDAEAKGRVHPSTAPAHPAPGKRFLIIRSEFQPPQHSLRLGFDSFSSSFPGLDSTFDHLPPLTANSDNASSNDKPDNMSFKRRWSLLGKVLPFSTSQDTQSPESKRTWEEELEQARRDTAASRLAGKPNNTNLGPPTPPKHPATTTITPSTESTSSTGSTPLYDIPSFIFRFTLTWQTGPNGGPQPCGPTRDRVLTRPRLPAPAQARVSVRSGAGGAMPYGGRGYGGASGESGSSSSASSTIELHVPRPLSLPRSDSPPPISPGLPPETRRVSGLLQTGLISEARNARPLTVGDGGGGGGGGGDIGGGGDGDGRLGLLRRPSLVRAVGGEKRGVNVNVNVAPLRVVGVDGEGEGGGGYDYEGGRGGLQSPVGAGAGGFGGYEGVGGGMGMGSMPVPGQSHIIRAERPMGVFAAGAVYAGRALAEWGMVVGECNSFVDRRRDEGVLGLSDVEVPTLGVEGLGIRARG